MHPLRRQIEREQLDGDETLALRVVRAKHRSKSAGTDLMQNTKRPERIWRRSAGRFPVQRRTPRTEKLPRRRFIVA
jgi:hypothetical protein